MATTAFERARSPEAKQQREAAILDAARRLGSECSIRDVTLTDIAAEVGLHKSAMLRYFESRELIFLRLAAEGWSAWSAALTKRLRSTSAPGDPRNIAAIFAATLVELPLLCDLLAHVPLNLERNVSRDAVREFKLATVAAREPVEAELVRLCGLSSEQVTDLFAVATSLAGTMWQIAHPGPILTDLYRTDPQLAHIPVDVEPRLTRILDAVLRSYTSAN